MKTRTCFQKLMDINKILDSDLSNSEKLVLIKMSMYDDCYITNKWLSVTLGTSVDTIKRAIVGLKSKKIITVKRTVKANTKIQRRRVIGINLECLNINTRKTGIKTQSVMSDPLKKENSLELQRGMYAPLKPDKTTDEQAEPSQRRLLELQRGMCAPLKLTRQDPKNGTTTPTTGISNTLSTYNNLNNLNNKYISKKTIRYIMYTQTQKTQKRSDFSMNKSTNTTKKKKRFKKPTVEEVRQYCAERGNTIDPEYFHAWYAARGWCYGKGFPMVDWKAAVRTWEYKAKKRKEEEEKRKGKEIIRLPIGQARQEYKQSWYDKDAEIRRAAVMAATKNDK